MNTLKTISNTELIEEAAKRIKALYQEVTGKEYRYGEINFIFLDGKFLGVQEETGHTLYQSQISETQSEEAG